MKKRTIPAGTRRWLLVGAAAVVVLLISLSALSSVYVDFLWFREVRITSVFWTTIRIRFLLGAGFGLLFFALLLVNLQLVRRFTPSVRAVPPQQEALEQARRQVEPYLRWLVPAVSGLIALLVGLSASGHWSTYLLWRNGGGRSFGATEPLFDRDPAFYIFTLPWLQFVQSWLFSALIGVTVLVAVAHVLWGNIQPAAATLADKATPQVRGHLSVLLGLILLTRAAGYYLARFDLLTSDRGVVEGASYTDVRAQLPALNVLTLAALICAGLFFVNIRLRRWGPPVIAVGLLAAVSLLLGRAYPAFVQQFSVKPQEQDRETPYIEANIEGTRRAFGLDAIDVVQQPADPTITAEDLEADSATLSNIRLWRPNVIQENFQSLQRIRQYYEFPDVDIDRYTIDGETRVLMVAGREVSQSGIAIGGRTWQNTHLVYTHGFGAVASPVNATTREGAPTFTLGDIPPAGVPEIEEPRIYYGEVEDVPFVVTRTRTRELDYEGQEQGEVETTYTGQGGIPLGNRLQRALFAWRYSDINLLISGLIDADSRIMINRQIEDRVAKAAPFLRLDADPYLSIVDGRLIWIYDAYTTSTDYPYSQSLDLASATDGLLTGRANYIRNSVKITVDAYDGSLTYYLVDPGDPIAQAWSQAFPDLFTPGAEAGTDLVAHFRYPENLFQIQASQFASYHVTDPGVLFQKQDVWQIAPDPTAPDANGAGPAGATDRPMRPYYVLMRLPDRAEEPPGFRLILPFTPENRQNMTSWLVADSDPGSYGRLTAYTFPRGRNIDGPTQVYAQANQDPTLSTFRTQQGQLGSDVVFGDLLVIPIDDSLLYVLPVYVRAEQDDSIPELKLVVAVAGGSVGVGRTLDLALAAAVEGAEIDTGGTAEGETDPGGPDPGIDGGQVADLLAEAITHFEAADEALRAGDLATYQDELATAQELVEQASTLADAGSGPIASDG